MVWRATRGARLRLNDADAGFLLPRDGHLSDDDFFVCSVRLGHLLQRLLLVCLRIGSSVLIGCEFFLVVVCTGGIEGDGLFWRSREDHPRPLNDCLLLRLLLLLGLRCLLG